MDVAGALPLNSTDTHCSAMKLSSNCMVFSNMRMMSERGDAASLNEGREN